MILSINKFIKYFFPLLITSLILGYFFKKKVLQSQKNKDSTIQTVINKNKEFIVSTNKIQYKKTEINLNNASKNINFNLRSDYAIQNKENIVFFNNPIGLMNDNGKIYNIKSDEGIQDQANKTVTFKKNVNFNYSSFFDIYCNKATYYIVKNIIKGNEKVKLIKDNSTLTSDNFLIDNNKKTIKLNGNVLLVIKK